VEGNINDGVRAGFRDGFTNSNPNLSLKRWFGEKYTVKKTREFSEDVYTTRSEYAFRSEYEKKEKHYE